MTTRTCSKCGETKPLDEYHRDKSSKYGRRAQCKPCDAERRRRYYEANRDKVAERDRRYYEANRDKVAERDRRYYEENREQMLERRRRYREENREQVTERKRRYYEETQELSKMMATVPPHTRFTPEEDTLIMSENDMTVFQKAVELGRTHKSVKARREYLRERRASAPVT